MAQGATTPESCTRADNSTVTVTGQNSCANAAKANNTFVGQGSTTPESCTRADNSTVTVTSQNGCANAAKANNNFVGQGSTTPESCTRADNSTVPVTGQNSCANAAKKNNNFVGQGSTIPESCTRADNSTVTVTSQNSCTNAATANNNYTAFIDRRMKIECDNAANEDHDVVHIDPTVKGHLLEVVSSNPWSPGQLADKSNGKETYLLSDGVTLSDNQLSKVCPTVDEVIVPNSVTKIGIGFVINLNTNSGTNLTIYIGDSVAAQAPAISIAETANVLPNDVTTVAAFYRRCPADGDRKYEFDNLTPRTTNGDIDRTVATAAKATKLHTMNDRSERNLDNGIVDTCLN